MKNNFYLLLLFVGLSLNGYAQSLPNPYFLDASDRICAFDSTATFLQYDDWLIYQTLDNKWDGPMDSTRCIGVIPDINGYKVDLDQIDPEKALFIKSLLNDDNKILLNTNDLYRTEATIQLSSNPPVDFSADCPNGLCTGIIVGIEIPNEDSTGTALRIHSFSLDDSSNSSWFNVYNGCLPIEKFDTNYLKEFVFKITYDTTDLMTLSLSPYSTYIEQAWGPAKVTEDILALPSHYDSSDSTYYLTSWDIPVSSGWGSNFFILHTDSTYPSSDNISYLDVSVDPNPAEAQNIELTINVWNSLTFQPFTNIRGGLVNNSDSIHHNFSLINNGGDMCFNNIVDLVFDTNEKFVYNGGNVNFASASACMQFMEGGKLIVADHQTFHYGQNGRGMLALRQGGTIELGKNSTLIVNNTLFMFERRTDIPQQIYMTLNPGSSLLFGEHAHISNRYSLDKTMKLNVYMNGGVLDDQNLSSEERSLINRIYPDDIKDLEDPSFMFPNPAAHYTTWVYHASEITEVQFAIYDANGKLIETSQHDLAIGPNEIPFDLRLFNSGIYFLKWTTAKENGVKKWIKQ